MQSLFIILLILSVFLPILIWWIRNIARVLYKKDLNFITDNLFKIFTIGLLIAVISIIMIGLYSASII